MPSPMLHLGPDNSLLNGDGHSIVLKGAGLGGTSPALSTLII
jgi:hypothetical protein